MKNPKGKYFLYDNSYIVYVITSAEILSCLIVKTICEKGEVGHILEVSAQEFETKVNTEVDLNIAVRSTGNIK